MSDNYKDIYYQIQTQHRQCMIGIRSIWCSTLLTDQEKNTLMKEIGLCLQDLLKEVNR